jgi:SNF2 family DNA or RNA helicase
MSTAHQHNARSHTVYILPQTTVCMLTQVVILKHSTGYGDVDKEELEAVDININQGTFKSRYNALFPVVHVIQQGNDLVVGCPCDQPKSKLCEHQVNVLMQLMHNEDFKIFFDDSLRNQRFKTFAADYGLQNELDKYFQLYHTNHKTTIRPIHTGLVAVTAATLNTMRGLILPQQNTMDRYSSAEDSGHRCIVFKQHKYYKHLVFELYDAPVTKDGKIKNPLTPVEPLQMVWESDDPLELKFFSAISKFQNTVDGKITQAALESLKVIVKNPLNLPFYLHQSKVSEKVTAPALLPVSVSRVVNDIALTVNQKKEFYEVSGKLKLGETEYSLNEFDLKFGYFIEVMDTLYLVKDMQMLGLLNFFKSRKDDLLIHQSKYQQFHSQILDKLEERTEISYKHIKTATAAQLQQQGFNNEAEKIIYLSDFGQHVMIVPVMRYGEVEIPIRTRKQINAMDDKGKYFIVQRNQPAELQFTAMLLQQHPHFEEQLLTDDLQYFYLHKRTFLDADWFLNAFEAWHNQNITILGFNEISGNKLNAHKAKISVQVLSGINWFNTVINARFGKRKASLKHLHKAIRNKSKFVQLDDGTLGILPAEWIERFEAYFNAGEIGEDDTLHTAKVSYASIAQLYEDEMLDAEVRAELQNYQQKLVESKVVKDVDIPTDLNAELRRYQVEGLNWLNFLDDFNFGGCLADDMGLGKTIQIIAFILLQRKKRSHNTNLLVVPTSLIFNWQAEIQKFAPSIKILTIYGADRIKNVNAFAEYEVVLTSYGTLLADVGFLKEYNFNYVFLDESQNIKNPNSQRYKAVRLLKARNRIAITGTPIENNTFDLYSQLSFACPGLLGSKQYFKDIYSSPIDKFKVSRRLAELQKKIRPFVLRRTKQEVASELPDKTEMVLHCEMQPDQRKIYDAYEREFREFISATTHETLPKRSMHVLKGITRLRQICDSPLLLKGEKLPGNASAKIDVLIEQIQSKSPRHKILVFSQFVSMLNLIGEELHNKGINYVSLTGNTRNREAVVNEFQDNNNMRVFLISLKAGGTGLNLTAADYIYLVDPWWNPAIENQAIDRAYRIGQKKNVVAVRLICPDTVEEKMMQLQENKKGLASELIDSGANPMKTLNREDLLALVSSA